MQNRSRRLSKCALLYFVLALTFNLTAFAAVNRLLIPSGRLLLLIFEDISQQKLSSLIEGPLDKVGKAERNKKTKNIKKLETELWAALGKEGKQKTTVDKNSRTL